MTTSTSSASLHSTKKLPKKDACGYVSIYSVHVHLVLLSIRVALAPARHRHRALHRARHRTRPPLLGALRGRRPPFNTGGPGPPPSTFTKELVVVLLVDLQQHTTRQVLSQQSQQSRSSSSIMRPGLGTPAQRAFSSPVGRRSAPSSTSESYAVFLLRQRSKDERRTRRGRLTDARAVPLQTRASSNVRVGAVAST